MAVGGCHAARAAIDDLAGIDDALTQASLQARINTGAVTGLRAGFRFGFRADQG
jgi:hypothetical protein